MFIKAKNDTVQKEKKQNALIKAISDVFRRLTITVNLTVYSIYLIYLIYSLARDVGIKAINIALIFITAAFMIVYLVLRLSDTKKRKEIKQIKKYYKRFKLIARAVSSITAVYALIVSMNADPFALIVALLGAVFVIIRLVVELISYLVQRKLRKIKEKIMNRKKTREELEDMDPDMLPHEEGREKTVSRRKKRKNEKPTIIDELEEKIVPIDDCLLSDIEEI